MSVDANDRWYYVAADSAALIEAFEAIGAQLKAVRLTQ
jgi:hypothetical protein